MMTNLTERVSSSTCIEKSKVTGIESIDEFRKASGSLPAIPQLVKRFDRSPYAVGLSINPFSGFLVQQAAPADNQYRFAD